MSKLRLLLCLMPLLAGLSNSKPHLDEASDLPEDQVEEVLALYRKHCKSTGYGRGPANEEVGGYGYGPNTPSQKVNIICKEGKDEFHPPKKQIIQIPTQKPIKNILFVEAPQIKYKHEINLISQGGQSPKTVIYVLPQKSSHQLKVWDKRGGAQNAEKPQVFFLKNDKNFRPPSSSQLPSYGPPPANPGPIYGPPQQKPVSIPKPSYGLIPTQAAPATTPRPVYGLPSQRPPQQTYGLPEYDHPNLGPEYEIVSVDQGTRNAYQNLFDTQQPQITSSSTLVQRLNGNLHNDLNSAYGETPSSGRVLFPSESIQNYKVQSPDTIKHESQANVKSYPEEELMTDAEAAKSLRSIIEAYENRESLKLNSTTIPPSTTTSTTTPPTTTTTTPEPTSTYKTTERKSFRLNTNLFDGNYVRSLISNAKNVSKPISHQSTNEDYNRGRIYRYFSSSDFNTPSFVPLIPPPYQPSSSFNSKRSVPHPGFEIFPANFVSYSYSKVDNDGTN